MELQEQGGKEYAKWDGTPPPPKYTPPLNKAAITIDLLLSLNCHGFGNSATVCELRDLQKRYSPRYPCHRNLAT
jgi:hypothetical protein